MFQCSSIFWFTMSKGLGTWPLGSCTVDLKTYWLCHLGMLKSWNISNGVVATTMQGRSPSTSFWAAKKTPNCQGTVLMHMLSAKTVETWTLLKRGGETMAGFKQKKPHKNQTASAPKHERNKGTWDNLGLWYFLWMVSRRWGSNPVESYKGKMDHHLLFCFTYWS